MPRYQPTDAGEAEDIHQSNAAFDERICAGKLLVVALTIHPNIEATGFGNLDRRRRHVLVGDEKLAIRVLCQD
jgi:hypothetical protein